MRIWTVLLWPILLVLLQAGCSGRGGQQSGEDLTQGPAAALPTGQLQADIDSAAAGGIPALPPISELDRLSSSPSDYADQQRSGNSWDQGLPNRNVTNAVFQPVLNEESQLLEPAYAIYSWEGQQDQESPLAVLLQWVSEDLASLEFAIGVANFATGRWDWQKGREGQLFFSGTADHLSAQERIYVAVVLYGEQPAALHYMLLGTLPPWLNVTDDLDNDPLLNLPPREVTLDASSSFATLHPISHFDFDWDGDGSWDLEKDPDGIASHVYGSGNHIAIVRVTDTEGYSDTLEREIDIVDPQNQSPVAAFSPDSGSGAAPFTVLFDPSASNDADGVIVEYRWDFDNDGDWDEQTQDPDSVSYTYTTLGQHLVTLEVEDNFFATNQFQLAVSTSSGWSASQVVAGILPDSWLAMATTGEPGNELASIAYVDSSGAVRVVTAASAPGDSWEAPKDPAPGEDRLDQDSNLELLAAADGNTLLLAWDVFDNFQGGRQISFSSGNAGLWQEPQVINDSDDVPLCDMQLLDGKPVIGAVFRRNILNFSFPLIYLATDQAGLAWGTQQAIQDPVPDLRYTNMALGKCLVEGQERLLAFYSSADIPKYFLDLRRAGDAAGMSWEDPFALVGSSYGFLAVPRFDGIPMACFADDSSSQPIRGVRAMDAAAAGFNSEPEVLSKIRCGNMSFVELGGKPLMCCYDRSQNRITLYRADDAAGTAWQGPEIVVDSPDTGRRIAMTVVEGELLLAWTDAGDNLMCAWYQY
ncbi:PKD domain-containing protein [bacterium]|nr:PKD domain-containing protein [bacterium]